MRGPFVLTKYCVDMVVPPKRLGVYALSNDRDSIDIIRRAEKSTGDEIKGFFQQYKYFWVAVAYSQQDAFRIQCEQYHRRMAGGDNTIGWEHPKAPKQSGWHCPVCDCH